MATVIGVGASKQISLKDEIKKLKAENTKLKKEVEKLKAENTKTSE